MNNNEQFMSDGKILQVAYPDGFKWNHKRPNSNEWEFKLHVFGRRTSKKMSFLVTVKLDYRPV